MAANMAGFSRTHDEHVNQLTCADGQTVDLPPWATLAESSEKPTPYIPSLLNRQGNVTPGAVETIIYDGQSSDFEIFTALLNAVRNAELIDINEKTKSDVYKVVHCFAYIKTNIPLIYWSIPRKKQRATYQAHSQHGARDFNNEVLRDFNLTSFHIGNFETAEEAKQSLLLDITEFEEALVFALENNVVVAFANQIRYDKNTGCLEARIKPALAYIQFIKTLNEPDSYVDLNYEMSKLVKIKQQFGERWNGATAHPYVSPLLGKSFFMGQNTEFNHAQVISNELIETYMEQILGDEDFFSPSLEPEKNNAYAETYTAFSAKSTINIGSSRYSMIQYHFHREDIESALDFVHWLIEIPELKAMEIRRAGIDDKSNSSTLIVRLTRSQLKAIATAEQYDEAVSAPQLLVSAVSAPTLQPTSTAPIAIKPDKKCLIM